MNISQSGNLIFINKCMAMTIKHFKGMAKMRKFIIYIMTFVCICSLALTGCTSNENVIKESTKPRYKDTQAALIKYMDNYSSENQFSGTVLVAKGDDVLLDRGYGMADYDKHIKNNSQTVFEIGSITKQFTATAILMLQEKKLLNVQDKLSKYISDYPNGDKIKIYNLLTHTSGIDEYAKSEDDLIKKAYLSYTPLKLIESFKNKPLNFNPGTKFEYSNSNYILLGYIIEKVSGMKYEDYIEKNIIKPLKLRNTGTLGSLSNQAGIKNKAIGYLNIDTISHKYKKGYKIDGSYPYAAGEIYSTVEDLYRWNKALNEGKLINKQSLDQMFTPYLSDYGYGWYIDKLNDKDKIVFHGGSIPGYTSFIERDINKKYVIIVLSNDNNAGEMVFSIGSSLSQIVEAGN